MYAVEGYFTCCDRNKGKDKTKSKNALAFMQNNVKRVDIFGYNEPAFRHNSSIGGCLTILEGLFVLQGFIQLILNAVEGPIQINRDIKPIGKIKIDENFVRKAVKVWPVNISDFINPKYQKSTNYKIMRFKDSFKTKRVMKRGGKDYYEYRLNSNAAKIF